VADPFPYKDLTANLTVRRSHGLFATLLTSISSSVSDGSLEMLATAQLSLPSRFFPLFNGVSLSNQCVAASQFPSKLFSTLVPRITLPLGTEPRALWALALLRFLTSTRL